MQKWQITTSEQLNISNCVCIGFGQEVSSELDIDRDGGTRGARGTAHSEFGTRNCNWIMVVEYMRIEIRIQGPTVEFFNTQNASQVFRSFSFYYVYRLATAVPRPWPTRISHQVAGVSSVVVGSRGDAPKCHQRGPPRYTYAAPTTSHNVHGV